MDFDQVTVNGVNSNVRLGNSNDYTKKALLFRRYGDIICNNMITDIMRVDFGPLFLRDCPNVRKAGGKYEQTG